MLVTCGFNFRSRDRCFMGFGTSWNSMRWCGGSSALVPQRLELAWIDPWAEAFIFLVILVFFNDWAMPAVVQPFEVIEFFSGLGNVGKSCRWAGHATAQLDIAMGSGMRAKKQNAFDMASPAGLALLGLNHVIGLIDHRLIAKSIYFITCYLRLAVWVLLHGSRSGFFMLCAVVCTSFSSMNVGTSRRSSVTPWGDTSRPHVRATWFDCAS